MPFGQGVSKALVLSDPDLRGVLKSAGFITRDARQKERKKIRAKGSTGQFPVLQEIIISAFLPVHNLKGRANLHLLSLF